MRRCLILLAVCCAGLHQPARAQTTMLGGLLGGILPELRARRRGGRPGKRYSIAGLVGVVTGLLAAVGYAFGVRLLELDVHPAHGEAGVFLVAALGALYGIKPAGTATTGA
jgi:hypothetical protein